MARTSQETAAGVLAHLRAVGPQTAAQIRENLGITKRETEHALWMLQNRGAVELEWPTTSPLTYKATA